MSKVFVVQAPLKRVDGILTPMFDYTEAEKYGDLSILLPHGDIDIASGVATLEEKLAEYAPADYLVLSGNPSYTAAAVVIAARNTGGAIRLLQWDKRGGMYYPVALKISWKGEKSGSK